MTNWVLVAVGLAVIAMGALVIRFAPALSALQQRQGKFLRHPDFIRRRYTPGLTRMAGVGFMVWGVIAVFVGGFHADKL